MPNLFAYIVLFGWPVVAWVLFRRLPPGKATVATILWGYLLLPERPVINPPMLPPIGKELIPSLSAAVMLWLTGLRQSRQGAAARGTGRKITPTSRMTHLPWIALSLLSCSALLTAVSNDYPLVYGDKVLPALRLYDALSMAIGFAVMLLPLLLAQRHLVGREIQLFTLRSLVWGGLVYSLLMLFELRMSPQLNNMIYGFFPHSFIQHMRDGGFRPIVFLAHGLRVGIFMVTASLAAAALARQAEGKLRLRWIMASLWLAAVVTLSHNTGATLILFVLLPVTLLLPARLGQVLAMLVAVVILIYPIARGAGLIPTNWVVRQIATISPERADSFEFRLRNEDALLAKAGLKPLSGWGGYNRMRVFDVDKGKDESTTDGAWIILIGTFGWVGYLALFGMVCLPVIVLWRRFSALKLGWADVGLSLLLAGNLVDLIPNSSLVPPTWLIAGLLWARLSVPSAYPALTGVGSPRTRSAPSRGRAPEPPPDQSRPIPSNT